MAASQENLTPDPRPNQELRRRICAELWTSLVALIRSYVAAHDLAKPAANHARLRYTESGRLIVRGENKTFALDFDPAAGAGSWSVHENGLDRMAESGRFEIDEDSQVALSDRAGKLELEVAAEAFTAKLFEE